MKKIEYAIILPHAPILLPDTGSPEDHRQVKATLQALKTVGDEFKKLEVDEIIISSPHEDWGFSVPLYFLDNKFSGKITSFLTGFESPREHYQIGREFLNKLPDGKKYAVVASGDLSHCLKKDGPYGFSPDGPKFDKNLVEDLKQNDVEDLLDLDDKYPEAADCGLRSFAFALGIFEEAKIKISPKVLSYEGPFGVGYLVAKLI
jgi:aromatic ring-opening dioxygenase LigB subunit